MIEACVAVVQTGPGAAKDAAALTLSNIARQEQHVGAMVAAGAIEACVAVLQTGPGKAKRTAARTLATIAHHEQYVNAVVAAGAVEACVAVLQTGPDDTKEIAACTLSNIATEEQHLGALVAAGAIEACIAVLQTGPDEYSSDATLIERMITLYPAALTTENNSKETPLHHAILNRTPQAAAIVALMIQAVPEMLIYKPDTLGSGTTLVSYLATKAAEPAILGVLLKVIPTAIWAVENETPYQQMRSFSTACSVHVGADRIFWVLTFWQH